ncbi:MAG: hypothetical protein LC794_01635 [Acidobacteria bacterium]|nr:hypothetical protein [Acidobacteriota bacterium]
MPDESLIARVNELELQLHELRQIRVKDAQRLFDEQDARVARETIRELKLEKAQLELALEKAKGQIEKMQQAPKWLLPVGVGFGLLTFVFLMAIVFLSMAGRDPSRNGKFALLGVMAFGAAFASATWIGNAVMTGEIKSMEGQNPLTVSATGGFAIFLLVFVLGYWFYIY